MKKDEVKIEKEAYPVAALIERYMAAISSSFCRRSARALLTSWMSVSQCARFFLCWYMVRGSISGLVCCFFISVYIKIN